ncbi:hypothetical protein, partial [Burkholderia pseudomallei]
MLITAIITITGIDARIGAGHGSAAPPAAAKRRRVARRARRFSHMAIGAANADTHRLPAGAQPRTCPGRRRHRGPLASAHHQCAPAAARPGTAPSASAPP